MKLISNEILLKKKKGTEFIYTFLTSIDNNNGGLVLKILGYCSFL